VKRVVLVGGTDGLGRALAAEYASRGSWVTVLGRSREKLDSLVASLSARFPAATVRGVVCDLADEARIEPAFREAIEATGHCDLFLYNAGVMHGGDGVTCEPERGLDNSCPRQAASGLVQGRQTGRQAGNAAGPGPDRVVHQLVSERHGQIGHRSEHPRDGDEAVEIGCAATVPPDRMPPAEQPRHHRLGHAGGEPHRDGGIRGRAALGEDLDPGRRRRRVSRRHARSHRAHASVRRVVPCRVHRSRPRPRPQGC